MDKLNRKQETGRAGQHPESQLYKPETNLTQPHSTITDQQENTFRRDNFELKPLKSKLTDNMKFKLAEMTDIMRAKLSETTDTLRPKLTKVADTMKAKLAETTDYTKAKYREARNLRKPTKRALMQCFLLALLIAGQTVQVTSAETYTDKGIRNKVTNHDDGRVIFHLRGYLPHKRTHATVRVPVDIDRMLAYAASIDNHMNEYAKVRFGVVRYQTEEEQLQGIREVKKYTYTSRFILARHALTTLTRALNRFKGLFRTNKEVLTEYFDEHPKAMTQLATQQATKSAAKAGNSKPRFKRFAFTLFFFFTAAATMGLALWAASSFVGNGLDAGEQKKIDEALDAGKITMDGIADNAHGEIAIANMIDAIQADRNNMNKDTYYVEKFEYSVHMLEKQFETAKHGYEAALNGKLSMGLFLEYENHHFLAQIFAKSNLEGKEMMAYRPSDILQYPASWVASETGFNVLLHVPLVNEDNLLTLYRILPSPITLPDGKHLNFDLGTEHHIAISKSKKWFRNMEHDELAECTLRGPYWDCTKASVLRRAPDAQEMRDMEPGRTEFCLWALLEKEYEFAAKSCPTHAPREEAQAVAISTKTASLFATTPSKGTITCDQTGERKDFVLRDLTIIQMEPGCHAETADFHISTSSDLHTRDDGEYMKEYQFPGIYAKNMSEGISKWRQDRNETRRIIAVAKHVINETQTEKAAIEEAIAILHHHTPSGIIGLIAIIALLFALLAFCGCQMKTCCGMAEGAASTVKNVTVLPQALANAAHAITAPPAYTGGHPLADALNTSKSFGS